MTLPAQPLQPAPKGPLPACLPTWPFPGTQLRLTGGSTPQSRRTVSRPRDAA